LTPGGGSAANAVNDLGQAVGNSDSIAGVSAAVLFENGNVTDLGSLAGEHSDALGINDVGQVVGVSAIQGDRMPFLWEGGAMTPLPTPFGATTWARAINDAGQIAGHGAVNADDTHALLWDDGALVDLGTLGGANSFAYDINGLGHVVGEAARADSFTAGFLFKDGVMQDLSFAHDQPGWRFFRATSINDSGQIVGYAGHSGTGAWAGVVLDPVPEPASGAALLLGLGLLKRRAKKGPPLGRGGGLG
jgi:probable HAF family extracellular repeat protein